MAERNVCALCIASSDAVRSDSYFRRCSAYGSTRPSSTLSNTLCIYTTDQGAAVVWNKHTWLHCGERPGSGVHSHIPSRENLCNRSIVNGIFFTLSLMSGCFQWNLVWWTTVRFCSRSVGISVMWFIHWDWSDLSLPSPLLILTKHVTSV